MDRVLIKILTPDTLSEISADSEGSSERSEGARGKESVSHRAHRARRGTWAGVQGRRSEVEKVTPSYVIPANAGIQGY